MWDLQNADGLSDGRFQPVGSNGLVSSAVRLALVAAAILLNLHSLELFLPVIGMVLAEAKTRLKDRWVSLKAPVNRFFRFY